MKSLGTVGELFREADRLKRTVATISKVKVLEAAIGELNKITLGEYWASLAAEYPDIDLAGFTGNILRSLSRIRKNQQQQTISGFRFPLSGDGSLNANIIFWLELLRALLPDKLEALNIYWHQVNQFHKASLVVYLKPMPPSRFICIVDSDHVEQNLIVLTKPINDVISKEHEINYSACNPNLSMMEVLQTWPQLLGQRIH